jgi:hypothetical protein
MIRSLFLQHPEEKNMTYFEHLQHAFYFSANLLRGSIALFIHGLVPYFFEDTGSNIIREMNKKI